MRDEIHKLVMCLQQQAKHQGSPWKGPGLKPSSPRVSRLPGFEPRLLEPEEHAWDSSSDVPPSSSPPFVGHDDTSSEARAAPKEADSESGAEAQNESAGGFHGGQLKTSKGSAQKRAGSIVGLTQGSGVQRGEGGRGCAALTARKGVAKVHRSQSFAVSITPRQVFSTMFHCKMLLPNHCKSHGSTNTRSAFMLSQQRSAHSLIFF